ncbi:hypothetical protein PHET_07597 [Paragonimus heterotremus]|uniref:Cx9C motif-containing protein 4 n=1 Tax=Paragonimus heterotremus TaxID=100268 RepID=A0A8J4T6P9_9TREM|nr:hypothetical protein PHET_07597 [Paragonimus heterotremus]
MKNSTDETGFQPCHPLACAIQQCLSRHQYREEKCEKEIIRLIHCCRQYSNAKQVCCEGWDQHSLWKFTEVDVTAKSD